MRISKIASRRVSPILTLWALLFELHSVHPMRVSRLMGDRRQKTVLGSQRSFGMLNYFCGGQEQLLMYNISLSVSRQDCHTGPGSLGAPFLSAAYGSELT